MKNSKKMENKFGIKRERCEAMMCLEKTLITDPTTKA